MATVSFKEAAILSYLDKRKDLSDSQRSALESAIKGEDRAVERPTGVIEEILGPFSGGRKQD